MKKRILSIVLAICLLLTLVPTTAFADLTKETYVVAGVSELCGSNWEPNPEASPDNVMTDNDGDGTYQKVYTNVAVMDSYQFKVVKNNNTSGITWYGIDGGDKNFTFNVKSVCDVTITFDPATLKITVTGDGVEIPTTLNVESMRAVGDGNGNWLNSVVWDPAANENLMKEVSPDIFEITYTDIGKFNNYQVKFAANGSWSDFWGGDYQGSGIESDAVYNYFENIKIEVPYVLADVTLRLDLTNFDYATKTGAKFTVTVVDKASTSSKTTEPSVSAYATKAQLMDETFAPDADGYDTNIGKLAFGINAYGKVQNWYILGKDTGIDGDNTVIFADSKFTFGYFEDNRDEIKTDTTLWSDCTYTGTTPLEVYPNHYGASDLRVALQGFATDTSFFTTAEQSLMNATTVKTKDTKNSNVTYTTTDKLYLLNGNKDDYRIWAGSNNQIPLANESYWSSGTDFWLRTPSVDAYIDVISAVPGDYTIAHDVKDDGTCAQPASNLNLTNVVFSSAVTEKPSSDGPVAGNIPFDKAMTLRLDGSSMNIGTVEYDSETDTIKAQKGSISGKVALVVQGKNVVQKKDEIGEKDWYYSELVNEDYSISADLIMLACGLSSLDLDKCKIWLETEGADGMIYAVGNNSSSSKKDKLLSITAPNPITVPNGTSYEDMKLPDTVQIETEGNTVTSASVVWNTTTPASGSYNPDILTEQTVTLNGNVTCPDGVDDNGVPLTTTIAITISAADTVKAPQANNSIPTGEIKVDSNIWKAFINGITFDIFYKNTQTVTITANSNSVGIEYLLSDKELTVAELDKATFTAYNAPFNIIPNNEYVIYARLTNTSGNTVYINSNGIVIDSIAPVISGIKNGKTYCSAQTVTVKEKYIDSVTVNGKTVKLNANNQFTLTAAEGTQKIVATDKAGNVSAKMTVTVHDGHIDEDKDSFCDLCKTKIPVDSGEDEINSDDTKKDSGNKSPQTGNSFNSALWIALLLSCGGVIVVTGAYSKRKKHSAK